VWLVRDMALGRTEHELEIRWHFAPDLEVRDAGAGRMEVSISSSSKSESPSGASSGESALTLLVPQEVVPQDTVWQTSAEVSGALLSPAYGAYQPAPLVRSHARVLLPAETAAALVPRSGAIRRESEPLFEPRLASTTEAGVQVYSIGRLELDSHGESHGFFFALAEQDWSFGPWSSDARVLYCRIEKEKLTHLVVIGGTYASWQGQRLLQSAGPSGFFEWRHQDGVMNAAPGEFSVTDLFRELTSGTLSSAAALNISNRDSSSHDSSSRSSAPYAEKH